MKLAILSSIYNLKSNVLYPIIKHILLYSRQYIFDWKTNTTIIWSGKQTSTIINFFLNCGHISIKPCYRTTWGRFKYRQGAIHKSHSVNYYLVSNGFIIGKIISCRVFTEIIVVYIDIIQSNVCPSSIDHGRRNN